MSDETPPQDRLIELAKDIRIGMFTTIDAHGHIVSRPMAQQEVEFDGDFWFFAERDSRKVANITANPFTALTLTSNDTWISLTGESTVVTDVAKAEELWNGWVEAWLPQGPKDPSTVLIRFTPDTAEYWDTPGGRIASIISFVKSKITGERYDGGENEKVEL